MKTVQEAGEQLGRAWDKRWLAWLSGIGAWPMTVSLGPPSQREALSDWSRFVAWRDGWLGSGATLSLVSRTWPSLGGAQALPAHASFEAPEALAVFLGPERLTAWRRGLSRSAAWQAHWPDSRPIGRALRWLVKSSEGDAARMQALVAWLRENPGADLFVRQVPVVGIDTKWTERNGAVALELLRSLFGTDEAGASAFRQDRPRARMRLLDPQLRAAVGGLEDISAPIASISALSLPVRCAVIVENLQTFLAFDDISGVALFFGQGFGARGLSKVAWLRDLPILYWGDFDTSGFEILSAVRSELPHAASFGMDEATLLANRALCVPDPKQRRANLPNLTAPERAAYQQLLGDGELAGMRLEQERLAWSEQWPLIVQAASLCRGSATVGHCE